jgi:two-component system response regulator AtoC
VTAVVERARPSVERTAGKRRRVLVVDDAEGIRTYLASCLELRGYDVDTAEDGSRALALIEGGADPDAILLDVMMPGLDGLQTLERVRELAPGVPVVMLSVVGRTGTIVDAMRRGAVDYLTKPFEEEELEATLDKVLEDRALRVERDRLVQSSDDPLGSVIWMSPPMRRVRDLIHQIADTDVTLLIQGQSGTGKEIVARTLHSASSRSERSLVKVNCAALPSNLLESELFGYEKGAFTGANARKPGKFEVADRSTIFFDEIGEMSPSLQAKLLQVLQDRQFSRLGGNTDITVDVRVVAATHRRLEEMVREGSFREDLFFRLNVVSVFLPPLSERREEIPLLIDSFVGRAAARYGRPVPQLSDRLLRALDRHPFPGNVRELENMVKRIVVLQSEEPILNELARTERGERGGSSLRALIEEIERTAGEVPLREVGRRVSLEAERLTIDRVLQQTQWNRKRAARRLGVSYKTLLQKIRDCGLEPV